MLFLNKRENPHLNLTVQNKVLEQKEVLTFLGVEIDSKLTWKHHINHICNKISKSIAILRILRHTFPQHILLTLYMSLIHSYINYCVIIWGSAYFCHLKPLIVLQKKAIRIITNSKFRDPSAPILYMLKILPVFKVFELNCLKFMYRCLYENSFPYFKERLMNLNSSHDHATRYKSRLLPPFERLELCKNAFFCKSIHLWNNLNSNIK